jgi:integrase
MDQIADLFTCSLANGPSMAALKGNAMTKLVLCAPASIPTDTEARAFRRQHPRELPPADWHAGKTAAVRRRHLRALLSMKDQLAGPQLWSMPFGRATTTVFRQEAQRRRWKATTLTRELTNFAGAMRDLPLYSNSPIGFNMSDSSEFRDAIKTAQMIGNEELVDSQPAATAAEMERAVGLAPDIGVKTVLALTWSTGGRVGDVLGLQRRDIRFDPNFVNNGQMSILFARGKGARLAQPYTVHTVCPANWRTTVWQFVGDATSPNSWVFNGGNQRYSATTSMAMRVVNPDFTVRAIRRGALQAMAIRDVKDDTLCTFSGHTSTATLNRYLNWTGSNGAVATNARAAALFLEVRPPAPQRA